MPVQCTCPECGKHFEIPPNRARLKRRGIVCCSRYCRALHLSKSTRQPIIERFWRYVQKTETCWLWVGVKSSDGYGSMGIDGKQVGTHRVSWELHNGPIPDGKRVLHNCPGGDNPTCVNPAHLFLGTQKDNVQDCIRKRRRAEHRGTHKGRCY